MPGTQLCLRQTKLEPGTHPARDRVTGDVSTPSAPVEIDFVETPGSPGKVVLSGGLAYVADAPGGIEVIRFKRIPRGRAE